jgi:signal transduction histidine kinase
MEEEVKLRQAELIHTSRMASLGKIVAEIAHELNNPNNLIMFNTPMIRQAWEDAVRILEGKRRETGDFPLGGLPFSEMRDAVPKLLEGITDASLRMRNYVESLNEFSRPQTREQDREVSVRRIIGSAVGILNHEIMKRCGDFVVEYPPDSLVVAGSRIELEQVLINLIHNSLHALPDRDRSIRVSASANESSGSVEIVVRDEGEGMSPDVLKNLLRPFFTTKQDSGGLGLGLSISRSIIERHKGKLVFDSEVGKGTTARIILPGLECPR